MNDYISIAIIFYFSIVLHELIHFISYRICGLEIKRFYVFPLDFMFNKSTKVTFVFEKKYVGLVLPQKNFECTQKQLREKTIIALAAPVVAHVFFSVCGVIAYFLSDMDIFLNVSMVNILCFLSTLYIPTGELHLHGHLEPVSRKV